MQVIEKAFEGLSRSYGVLVPASELGALLDARIAEIAPTLNLKGFRPGKAPPAHIKRMYGKAIMGELVEKTVNETSQKLLDERRLRVASRPELKPVSDMDAVIAGKEDLSYDVELEVMPDFEPTDVTALSLARPVYRPTEEEVDEALAELVAQNRTYEARDADAAAESGDQLLIDFVGRIDGEAFDGGTAQDVEVVLGAGQFIPGFEDQLIGAVAGGETLVKVSFPDDYNVERLKGQAAEFTVEVKEVRAPKEAVADDALAERLGLADLAALREALRSNIERQYQDASRYKLKRALLDALDERHDIELPSRMVEAEFATIWREVEKDRAEGKASPEDEGKSEETLRAEYRKIGERRVRLGLVLAEIGRRENVVVSDVELTNAMREQAMQYGAQAQQIFDLMRQNPDIQAGMRAPLYEEKVVDLIISKAQVTDEPVSKEELLREDDLPPGYGAEAEPAPAEAAPAAEAVSLEAAPETDSAEAIAEAPPAKKATKPRASKAKSKATVEAEAEEPASEA
jgi:trigger factor